MKKIAVFFPGIGYTCEKPLLYYTASGESCNENLKKELQSANR